MARDKPLNWAVIGVGTAGRARARAIQRDEAARLVAVWRGRFAADIGVPVAADLQAAIDLADVVAICSPTAAHPMQIRTALAAGRHVVVEFPVAPTADEARSLFELARTAGRMLHVAHIELLDAAGQTLCAHIHPEFIERMEVSFERAGGSDADAAELALGNVARLHRVVAIGGPIVAIPHIRAEPGRLEATLQLRTGAEVACTFQQAPYFARRTRIDVHTPAGRWNQDNDSLTRDGAPQTLLGLGNLFARDQRIASAILLENEPTYVDESRILHVLDLVERLARGETGPVPQRSAA